MRSSQFLHSAVLVVVYLFSAGLADDLKPQRLKSNLSSVQPMTGIALWTTNEAASTAPIQFGVCVSKIQSDRTGERSLRLGAF